MTKKKAFLIIVIWCVFYVWIVWSYAGDYLRYYCNESEYSICQTAIKRIGPNITTGHVYFDYEWEGKILEGIDSSGVTDYEGKIINIAIHNELGHAFRVEPVFDVLFVVTIFCTFITGALLFSVINSICCKIRGSHIDAR